MCNDSSALQTQETPIKKVNSGFHIVPVAQPLVLPSYSKTYFEYSVYRLAIQLKAGNDNVNLHFGTCQHFLSLKGHCHRNERPDGMDGGMDVLIDAGRTR